MPRLNTSDYGTPRKGRKSEKRQRSIVVSVRLTPAELEQLQALAQSQGETLGTYMRRRALHNDTYA